MGPRLYLEKIYRMDKRLWCRFFQTYSICFAPNVIAVVRWYQQDGISHSESIKMIEKWINLLSKWMFLKISVVSPQLWCQQIKPNNEGVFSVSKSHKKKESFRIRLDQPLRTMLEKIWHQQTSIEIDRSKRNKKNKNFITK